MPPELAAATALTHLALADGCGLTLGGAAQQALRGSLPALQWLQLLGGGGEGGGAAPL